MAFLIQGCATPPPSRAEVEAAQRDAAEKRDAERGIFVFALRIVQIVDTGNMLAEWNDTGNVIWVHGYPTSGLVDGDRLNAAVRGTVRVKLIGTRQYESSAGKRTVRLFQYLPLSASDPAPILTPFTSDDDSAPAGATTQPKNLPKSGG